MSFQEMLVLHDKVAAVSSYTEKTEIFKAFFAEFEGDLYVLCKLLLCKQDPRAYRVRDKQLVKVLAKVFKCDVDEMTTDLEGGDQAETAAKFFEQSGLAVDESDVTIEEVDTWLEKLSQMTKDEERIPHFKALAPRLTVDLMRLLCKVMDHDLKINLGPKFVLDALHPKAFDAYKNSNNLQKVITQITSHQLDGEDEDTGSDGEGKPKLKKNLSMGISTGNPVKPMLAKPCKSFEEMWKRCPNGAYFEVKYDGERLQAHKKGDDWSWYSRNLKPPKEDKLTDVKKWLPKAVSADSIILDGEIVLYDLKAKKILPFGSLGVHKKKAYEESTVCYFVFDILYLDGKDLLTTPYKDRLKLLATHVKELEGHVVMAESTFVKTPEELDPLWKRVLKENLEGLMIKEPVLAYKPGLRHWLKLKKDYLAGMSDSADLIVLGSFLGTAKHKNLRSSFLMGVYDKDSKKFKTVCKCANGFDEETLAELQSLPMVKISSAEVPDWLDVSRNHIPLYVVPDPKKAPIWEIEGASFSKSDHHTAGGISIRFPRLKRMRDDKDWKTATNLRELVDLAQNSWKEGGGIPDVTDDDEEEGGGPDEIEDDEVPAPKKTKAKAAAAAKKTPANQPKIQAFLKPGGGGNAPQVVTAVSGVKYVTGDITKDLKGDPETLRVVFVLVDDSKKWPNTGVFSALNKTWPTLEKKYEQNKDKLGMGSPLAMKITNPQGSGLLFGSILPVIESKAKPKAKFAMGHFTSALESAMDWFKDRKVTSVHLSRIPIAYKAEWPAVEAELVAQCISAGVEVYAYSLNPPDDIEVAEEAQDDAMEVDEGPKAPKTPVKTTKVDPDNIFANTTIILTQVNEELVIRSLLLVEGAKIADPDKAEAKTVTHIICDITKNDPAAKQFTTANAKIHLVSSKWVTKSLDKEEQGPKRASLV